MKTPTRQAPVDPTRAFQPSADPGSLWLVGQYDDALRMLRGAALGRQGLQVLIGEPGTGKTLLSHALAVRLREDAVVVGRLPYPMLEGMDLRVMIAEAFDLGAEIGSGAGFTDVFRRFVDETKGAGRRVLLIADQAEKLTREVIGELRGLLHTEDPQLQPNLSVLLIGHRTLLDMLRTDGVEPDVLCQLRPLTREQTVAYVTHRVRAAGHRRQLFTPSALRKIWVVSEGIPRVVNTLCIDALVALRATNGQKVTASLVDRPMREPEEIDEDVTALAPVDTPRAHVMSVIRPKRRLLPLAGGAAVAATLVAAFVFTSSEQALWLSPRATATTAPAKAPDSARVATDAQSTESSPPSASVSETARGAAAAARAHDGAGVASAARHPVDRDDPGAMIDWLLKQRRSGGPTRLERQ